MKQPRRTKRSGEKVSKTSTVNARAAATFRGLTRPMQAEARRENTINIKAPAPTTRAPAIRVRLSTVVAGELLFFN